jgi:hypothetical protein
MDNHVTRRAEWLGVLLVEATSAQSARWWTPIHLQVDGGSPARL